MRGKVNQVNKRKRKMTEEFTKMERTAKKMIIPLKVLKEVPIRTRKGKDMLLEYKKSQKKFPL